MDREKVIKGIRKCLSHKPCSENGCPYEDECAVEHLNDPLLRDALALLKEQEAINVDAFVQWCIDNHIMGDATVKGIKYWVGKYKEIKKGR